MNPRLHALADYVTVLAFALSPTVFQLKGTAALVCYALAGVHLLLTLSSRFPGGVVHIVPFRLHGIIELAVAIVLPLFAWLGGIWLQTHERIFFATAGAAILVVYVLSNYRGTSQVKPSL